MSVPVKTVDHTKESVAVNPVGKDEGWPEGIPEMQR